MFTDIYTRNKYLNMLENMTVINENLNNFKTNYARNKHLHIFSNI